MIRFVNTEPSTLRTLQTLVLEQTKSFTEINKRLSPIVGQSKTSVPKWWPIWDGSPKLVTNLRRLSRISDQFVTAVPNWWPIWDGCPQLVTNLRRLSPIGDQFETAVPNWWSICDGCPTNLWRLSPISCKNLNIFPPNENHNYAVKKHIQLQFNSVIR